MYVELIVRFDEKLVDQILGCFGVEGDASEALFELFKVFQNLLWLLLMGHLEKTDRLRINEL